MNKLYKLFNASLRTRGWLLRCAVLYLIVVAGSSTINQVRAQQPGKFTITGTVTDTTGRAIAGVGVTYVSGKGAGTSTDNNGKFVLEVPAGTVLKLTYVGFLEKRITVTGTQREFKIVLQESVNTADEVIITAYSRKQTREALVGSVTTVKPGNLKIPGSNLTNALAGQVAGMIAYQPSGQPGQDNASFFIRGVTTFGYKQDPLILIDNVELTTTDLARLNVDDIESFSILKDASATALYGARGGNGVILVKTKEGKTGPAQISFRLENSMSQNVKSIELADPITYMNLANEATITRNPVAELPYTKNKISNTQASLDGVPGSNPYVFPAVDWLDMLFKKRTSTQRGNLSINGGGGVARYYVAGSYANDNGILRTDIRNNNNNNIKFQNYQLRSNVNINITDKTELIVRLSGTFNEYNGPRTNDASFSTDLYNLAVHTSPVDFPAYYPADLANQSTTHILFGASERDGTLLSANPYASLLSGHKNFSESRMLAQLELNQNLDFLTEGLNFHGILSTNRHASFDSQMYYMPFYYRATNYQRQTNSYTLEWINNQPNQAREYLDYFPGESSLTTFFYLQGIVDYSKTFAENHNLSGAIIGTRQQTLYSNAKDPVTNRRTLQYALPFRNLTMAGRATYSFKSKYFLEFNFGYNGSERFDENHRYGFFPTIGASWVLSQEKFWGNLSQVFDRFKLRGSYGLVGNDAIGTQRFFYLSDVNLMGGNYASFGTNNANYRPGVSINNYENRDVTWETSKQINLGLEFSLLKKLNVIAEVYQNNKYDILQKRESIPTTMGLEANISSNLGKVKSRGVDISLDGKHDFTNKSWIAFRGNLTFSENEYTKYEEPKFAEAHRYRVGQSVNANYGYIAERLFVDDNEAANSAAQLFNTGSQNALPKGGDIKYRDLNNDGRIDDGDQTFLGNNMPQVVYGFGLSAGIKSFDISAFFQGQGMVSFFIDPRRTSPFVRSPDVNYTGSTQLLKAYADDHWSESNQDMYALYPRLGPNIESIENNLKPSSWWLRDGSFLRVKSVELGYTLPKSLIQRIKVRNARFYVNGLNLLTLSSFKLWDPELRGNAFAYPIQKVFNIGLNVNL